tara:strand:- start:172 stop:441 length:270 start_codon:yes stop_codon:yes gene_type:complete
MIISLDYRLLAFRLNGHFNSVEPILLSYVLFYFYNKKTILIGIIISALVVSYANYVYLERVEPYSLFVNYEKVYIEYLMPQNEISTIYP